MEIAKTCYTCYFYKPHYAKAHDGEFYKVNSGHCDHARIQTMQFRRSIKYNEGCNYWQAAQPEEPEEKLMDVLKRMATGIEQIATHLKIENN